MQKILLIGSINNTLSNIYKSLSDKYQVQICKAEAAEVEGMIQMVDPELIVISMYGMADFDRKILDYIQNLVHRIPTMFVGTVEECGTYISTYNDSWFEFVERPVTQAQLLKRCQDKLELAGRKAQKSTGKNADAEKKKILVVDDNGVFLRTMNSLLTPKYEVLLAKSGERALPMAMTEQPDLILLDYEMPEWDGRMTLEKLRECEKTARIPVVFLTSVSDKQHILAVLKLQPQGYLLKPVDSEELEKKMAEIFAE